MNCLILSLIPIIRTILIIITIIIRTIIRAKFAILL
jgi:hypothetical protein